MFCMFWIFENWTDHTHGRRTDRHTDGQTTIAHGNPEKPIKANECIKGHKQTQKGQENTMQKKTVTKKTVNTLNYNYGINFYYIIKKPKTKQ